MAKVGDQIDAGNAAWRFSADVAEGFDAHIRRSVPLYDEGHQLVAQLSDFFVADDSVIYELGCATGGLLKALAERNAHKRVRIIGIDQQPAMLEKARATCAGLDSVELRQEDLVESTLEPADLVVAYYTMQFVRPRYRQDLFDRIYRSLNWGGAFVLYEKVRAPDARFQDIASAMYTEYKLEQGFEESELVNKARSLKGVLEPFSSQGNLDLLRRAGFVDVTTISKYICFEGFLAIK